MKITVHMIDPFMEIDTRENDMQVFYVASSS